MDSNDPPICAYKNGRNAIRSNLRGSGASDTLTVRRRKQSAADAGRHRWFCVRLFAPVGRGPV